jgi:hypothetical protein
VAVIFGARLLVSHQALQLVQLLSGPLPRDNGPAVYLVAYGRFQTRHTVALTSEPRVDVHSDGANASPQLCCLNQKKSL